jgi:hypothetical protein
VNSKNARSRMEASSVGKHEYRGKGRWVSRYWVRLGCWISPCYDLFSHGKHFETDEPFISLTFQFFSGHGKPQILNQQIWGHACTIYIITVLPKFLLIDNFYLKMINCFDNIQYNMYYRFQVPFKIYIYM